MGVSCGRALCLFLMLPHIAGERGHLLCGGQSAPEREKACSVRRATDRRQRQESEVEVLRESLLLHS